MQNPPRSDRWGALFARHWGKLWLVQAVGLLVIGFAIAWSFKGTPATNGVGGSTVGHPQHDDSPQIWTCSMHPQIQRDGPGDCPLCGMDLVPVTPSAGGMRTITISPAARELMKIQTTPVVRRHVTAQIRMVGKIEYDETRLSHITAWVSGRLDRLYVDYSGIEVKQGDHLVYIYSEELYAAQEELIQAIRHRRERPRTSTTLIQPIDLVESSREKLRLLGLTPVQIEEIEQRGTPSDHITIYSPIGGIIIEKLRQEGDRVRTGDRIYTVADLRQVWVKLDAYESDLQWLRYGQQVEFSTEAYAGETFSGQIAFIDPVLNKDTRTVKVRVNVSNENGRLKPEMFVRAVVRSRVAAGGRVLDPGLIGKWISPMHPEIIKDEPGNCDICGMPLVRAESLGYISTEEDDASKPLVIPVSAALVTGQRAIVYVEDRDEEEPTFEGREIVLGPRAGDYYLVRHGLKEGDLVVTNGNFKLDSALQIAAKPSMMTPEGGGGGGHNHGGDASGGPMAGHQLMLPSQFKSKFEKVASASDAITAAVTDADVGGIRAAFAEVAEQISEIDGEALTGDAKTLWTEFSMLLSNDVAEGRDVVTLEEAERAQLALRNHIQRVRDSFGLVPGEGRDQIVTLDVPEEFQEQLARLWQVYQPIGEALASDDLPKAKLGITRLQPTLASIDASMLEAETASVWQTEESNLAKIASGLTEASDINASRSAFGLLSDEMIALVKAFGVGDAGEIYEHHCPMAFRGRGASWLQNNDQTRNPYFGATMLKCADRVDLISPSNPGDVPHTRQEVQD